MGKMLWHKAAAHPIRFTVGVLINIAGLLAFTSHF